MPVDPKGENNSNVNEQWFYCWVSKKEYRILADAARAVKHSYASEGQQRVLSFEQIPLNWLHLIDTSRCKYIPADPWAMWELQVLTLSHSQKSTYNFESPET